jgi:hypothetical protein
VTLLRFSARLQNVLVVLCVLCCSFISFCILVLMLLYFCFIVLLNVHVMFCDLHLLVLSMYSMYNVLFKIIQCIPPTGSPGKC